MKDYDNISENDKDELEYLKPIIRNIVKCDSVPESDEDESEFIKKILKKG